MKLHWIWTQPAANDPDWREHALFKDRISGVWVWALVIVVMTALMTLGVLVLAPMVGF